ncbi:DUF3221 domain-containing protein [Lysinibacillus sp. NPDC097162]|uniref:DUF3221 domain-containing protein n=1 Tax=Lysinibacillus sp. NPDC097162 TaxID=3364140 RepID=UPI00380FA85D
MSKYEVEALKDLQASKNRVMTNVVGKIEQRAIPKQSRRWQYSMFTLILTVCIGLFVYAQVNNGDKLSANAVPILDEKIYDMVLQEAIDANESQESINMTFQTLFELDAYYVYAESKNIKFSEKAIAKQMQAEREKLVKSYKESAVFKDGLTRLNLTLDEFFDKYYKANALKWFAQAELMKEYYRKYENSYQLHAYFAVKKEAMDYFTAKYGQQIAYLENKYNVSKPNMSTQYKYGTVVAMEEDRFLVVTGALQEEIGRLSNEEMINKHTNGVWFPLLEVQQKITIGQNVNVTYSLQTQLNQYDFVANLDEIEISE